MGFGGGSQTNSLLNYQMLANAWSGQQQQQAYLQEAAAQREQASLVADEYEQAASQKAREVAHYAAEQAEMYLSGGVLMDGTPLAVVEETRQLGQQEVDALRRSGAARAKLLRMQANQNEGAGLQSLLKTQSDNTMTKFQADQEKRKQKQETRDKWINQSISGGVGLVSKLWGK